MSTFYIDPVNGNDSNDGSSWALAWKTITSGATAARIAPGDVIRIAKSPAPASIGNATWTDLSKTVTLANAQTANVDLCETAWTAANSATVTRQGVATDAKEGSYCMQIAAPASPAINTLYAYFAFSATDFSAYQKLSFWIKNEVAVSAGNWKICLCSDNAGTTIVDTFEIPAIPSTGRWLPLTIARTGGGNLGSSIQSVALYSSSVSPTASKYLRVDNIIACTTNGLNLQSLISKNTLEQSTVEATNYGNEGWYGIQSINGTTVLLDNETNTKANSGRGYSGTTETVTTYIRETFKTALAASSSTAVQEVQDSGNFGNNIQFQFGYEVGTENQNGETFFDGLNGNGYGIQLNTKRFVTLKYCNCLRYNYGIYIYYSNNNNIDTVCNINNNTGDGLRFLASANNTIYKLVNANNNGNYGIYFNYASSNILFELISINNNGNYGINLYYGNNNTIVQLANLKNSNIGVYLLSSFNNNFKIVTSSGVTGIYSSDAGSNYFHNSTFLQTAEFVSDSIPVNNWVWSLNHDNTLNNHWGFTYLATVNWQTGTVHGSEPGAWKTAITGSTRNTGYPVKLKIAEVAFNADSLVTVKAWVKKDHATNVGCRLVAYANNSSVNIAEQAATKANDTDWEELTITFTPEEAGVQEIYLESWYVAGNSNTYVGTITVTQA